MKNPFAIRQIDDPILLKPVQDVPEGGLSAAVGLRGRLVMACAKNDGLAVAAPQIGVNLKLFFAKGAAFSSLIINPTITEVSDETVVLREGCLSIPNFWLHVERPTWVQLQYVNDTGNLAKLDLTGDDARIVQHEMDHFVGLSLFDRVPEDDRAKLEKSPLYRRWMKARPYGCNGNTLPSYGANVGSIPARGSESIKGA